MTRDAEMRKRVQRLAAGDFRPDDLTRLFLWLRLRPNGIAPVVEIGHCVAHPDERNRGAVTDELRDFCVSVRFLINSFKEPLDTSDLPAEFPQVVRYNLGKWLKDYVREKLGVSRTAAMEVLETAFTKYRVKEDGRYLLQSSLNKNELVIVSCCNAIVPSPIYTDNMIWESFCRAWELNALLDSSERERLIIIKPGLILYAATAMHQLNIDLGNGSVMYLNLGVMNESIALYASASYTAPNGNLVWISHSALTTNLTPTDRCVPSLLARPSQPWRDAIEVISEMRLALL